MRTPPPADNRHGYLPDRAYRPFTSRHGGRIGQSDGASIRASVTGTRKRRCRIRRYVGCITRAGSPSAGSDAPEYDRNARRMRGGQLRASVRARAPGWMLSIRWTVRYDDKCRIGCGVPVRSVAQLRECRQDDRSDNLSVRIGWTGSVTDIGTLARSGCNACAMRAGSFRLADRIVDTVDLRGFRCAQVCAETVRCERRLMSRASAVQCDNGAVDMIDSTDSTGAICDTVVGYGRYGRLSVRIPSSRAYRYGWDKIKIK